MGAAGRVRSVALAVPRTVAALVGRGRPGPGAVVLAYHDVVPAEAASGYHVCAASLDRHLDLVEGAGFRFVAATEIVDAIRDGASVDGLAAVTFDDAFAGVAERAVPMLERRGIVATVFAVSDHLDGTAPWWSGAGRTMSAAALRDLAAGGTAVGSHTRTHPHLPATPEAAWDDEIAGSRAALEDIVGVPVDLFAYPSGEYTPAIRGRVAAAGYRGAFTFLNGRVVAADDPHRLARLTMGGHHGKARFAYHLARPADDWPDTQLAAVGASG